MTMGSDLATVHRVAVYWAPAPGSPWWQAGSQWLGRCAATALPLPQPVVEGVEALEFARLTAAPRRYGWHATLKAPFGLASGHDLEALQAALQRMAGRHRVFDLGPLQVCELDGFLALRPLHTPPELLQLEAGCVQSLQPLAAGLSAAELARRRRAGLNAEQEALLQAWGYPWVLQQFRFHLSLSGPLERLLPQQRQALRAAAMRQFHALVPCRIDRLSVFVEPAPGADFKLLHQLQLQP
jgi:putative phosphonate metabolism protein